MEMRRAAAVLCVLAAAALAACGDGGSPAGVDCPDIFRPMIVVQVTDASTGQPAAEGAGGSITDGAFTSPLVRYGTDRLAPQATGRPGTYDVVVTRPGFQSWTRSAVHVPAAECGTETVYLEAFLVPG
jgi:hypothetical protein